jgi:hypothetical protein
VNNSFVLGDIRGANQNAIFLHAVNHTVLKDNRFIYPQAPAAKPDDCYIFFRQNATNVVADGNSLCLSANHCTAWSAPADGCSTAPPQKSDDDASEGVCDIYAKGGTPCLSAY